MEELVARSDDLAVAELPGLLSTRLMGAVATQADDRALAAGGVAKTFPPEADPADDPWCRYRTAGLNVAEFAPLEP